MPDETPVPDTAPAPPAATPSVDVPATAAVDAAPEAPAPEAPAADAAAAEPAPEAPAADAAPAPQDLSPAATGARLAELFPALFGVPPRPIKLRIQADIQARAPGVFTKKGLSIFLHRHTTGTAYLRALASGGQRFDLDGQPAGDVADEHRDAAKAEVERRRAIVDARRQAEREAMRQKFREQAREQRRGPAPGAQAADATAAAGAPATEGPPRGPRPPRGDRPPHDARPGPRPERGPDRRQDRGEHRAHEGRGPRPDRRPEPRPAPRAEPHPPRDAAPADSAPPVHDADFEARRERAQLLRAFETTTLTRANFCALKGMKDAQLETLLVQARQERAERPPRPERGPAPHAGGGGGPGPRPQGDRRPPRPAKGHEPAPR